MFTTIDKALVAMIMAVLFLLSTYFNINLGFTEAQIAGFVTLITPFIVWLVPNKPSSLY